MPRNAFVDPQGEALTYAATQSRGQALPSGVTFDAAAETFTGTPPSPTQSLGITVNATDSIGLSSSKNFTANIQSAAPVVVTGIGVTARTPNQSWIEGQAGNLMLPSNTFTDALGRKMMLVAHENVGPNAPSWLAFQPCEQGLQRHGAVKGERRCSLRWSHSTGGL